MTYFFHISTIIHVIIHSFSHTAYKGYKNAQLAHTYSEILIEYASGLLLPSGFRAPQDMQVCLNIWQNRFDELSPHDNFWLVRTCCFTWGLVKTYLGK